MFVSLHFPIVDTRSFCSDSGRLAKPVWPLPSADVEFVRNFGPVRARPLGGLSGWIGESEICDASKALRLQNSPSISTSTDNWSLRVPFRRFYFDGLASGKFEIGFATTRRNQQLELSAEELRVAIDDILNLKVHIVSPGEGPVSTTLIEAGRHLANSYRVATTKVGVKAKAPANSVRCGTPLLCLEAAPREIVVTPYFTRDIVLHHSHGLRLSHCLVPHSNRTIRMWMLDALYVTHANWLNSRHSVARRLRMCLQRLHCEHECLRITLRQIMTKILPVERGTVTSDSLQQFFNESTKKIGILEFKSAKDFADELFKIARESTNGMRPGEMDALEQVLERCDLRPNIRRKIEKYSKQWGSVTIIENVEANYMGDVFKDISSSIIATRGSIAEGVISIRSSGNENIAEAIEKLDQLINSCGADVLPAETKKESVELLKGITDEAKKATPSKSVMKTLGASLMSILEKVAPIAKTANICFDILKPLWT